MMRAISRLKEGIRERGRESEITLAVEVLHKKIHIQKTEFRVHSSQTNLGKIYLTHKMTNDAR